MTSVASIRLIALDLDGTLLDSGLKLSDRNAEAVRKAVERGAQVVLATTRWYLLAKRTADRLGIETPIIANNGAIVVRQEDGSELLHLRLDREVALAVTALADQNGWDTFTTIDHSTFMRPRPGIIPEKLPAGLRVSENHAREVESGEPTSVLVYGNDAVPAICDRFLDKYGDRAAFSINRPPNTPHYVVLTHPDADKGRALAAVCADLGVPPAEALAMGDSESDLSMLRLAGLGIAMRNSPDEVQKAALHVAPSNDDDGVAWAIERFVL